MDGSVIAVEEHVPVAVAGSSSPHPPASPVPEIDVDAPSTVAALQEQIRKQNEQIALQQRSMERMEEHYKSMMDNQRQWFFDFQHEIRADLSQIKANTDDVSERLVRLESRVNNGSRQSSRVNSVPASNRAKKMAALAFDQRPRSVGSCTLVLSPNDVHILRHMLRKNRKEDDRSNHLTKKKLLHRYFPLNWRHHKMTFLFLDIEKEESQVQIEVVQVEIDQQVEEKPETASIVFIIT